MSQNSRQLVEVQNVELVLEELKRAIQQVTDPKQAKSLRDKAEAARIYCKAARLGLEAQNRAAGIKLRAERRAGQLLAALHLRGGDRKSKNHDDSLKLERLGITRNQSTRWQQEASVSEQLFEEYVRSVEERGRELTAAGLLRLAKQLNRDGKPTKSSGRGSRRTDSTSAQSEVEACLEEARDHAELLEKLLLHVYDCHEELLRRAERKHIRHLVNQIIGLLNEVATLVCCDENSSNPPKK